MQHHLRGRQAHHSVRAKQITMELMVIARLVVQMRHHLRDRQVHHSVHAKQITMEQMAIAHNVVKTQRHRLDQQVHHNVRAMRDITVLMEVANDAQVLQNREYITVFGEHQMRERQIFRVVSYQVDHRGQILLEILF